MRQNRRGHYRLVYPISVRPVLVVAQAVYPVQDLSVAGVRVQRNAKYPVAVGDVIAGHIAFHDGARECVEGFAIRDQGGSVVILFTKAKGISPRRMMIEQRLLIARFGALIGS